MRWRSSWLLLDRKEELELGRELLLGVEAVGEVDAANAAVSMDLHPKRLNVVRTIRTTRKVRKIELNLVPALIEPHRHCANERLDTCGTLVVGCTEATAHVLVIKHLHLKSEVLFEIFL